MEQKPTLGGFGHPQTGQGTAPAPKPETKETDAKTIKRKPKPERK